jgi:hypothetical protein
VKYNSIQNSFASGEISRKLKGRTNIEDYFQAVATMKNFLPMRSGGAQYRGGTCISASEHTSSIPGALFDFSPRDGETYTLIVQPGFEILARTSAGALSITQDTYLWNTRADFGTSTTAWVAGTKTETQLRSKVDSLQFAQSGDVLVIVDGEGELAPIVIFRTALNTLYADSLIHPTYINPTTNQPWLHPPLTQARVPYRDVNTNTNIRLKPSATTAAGTFITITAEDASAAAVNFFSGDVIGMNVKITHAAVTGVARVTAKGSDSSVTAVVLTAFGATTASSNFEAGAWSPAQGYPRSVCFYEQRLVFGGSPTYPDMLWCSMAGNIYFFMQRRLAQDSSTDTSLLGYYGAVKATDPFNLIPASVGANSIQWLHSSDSLLCGTTESEFALSGGQDSIFSGTSFFIKNISAHGSAKVQPVKAGSSILFVASDGRRILEIPKRLQDYNSAIDVTALVEGMIDNAIEETASTPKTVVKLKNKITKIAWNEHDGVLWCACRNGSVGSGGYSNSTLVSLTFDKTTKVLGWARHRIGGDPAISSLCVSPDVNNPGAARLFLLLRRNTGNSAISGGTPAYSLEYLSYQNQFDSYYTGNPNDSTYGARNAVYLDGASYAYDYAGPLGEIAVVAAGQITLSPIQQDSFPTGTSFAVVEIDGDIGTYLGEYTPDGSGVLTVPSATTTKTYLVGVRYEGEIKTMPIEAGAQFGVAQGSDRRSNQVTLCLDRSLGGTYKAANGNSSYDLLRAADGTPSALYSGERELQLNSSYNDPQTIIKQTKPYPMNILWLLHKGYTYDT